MTEREQNEFLAAFMTEQAKTGGRVKGSDLCFEIIGECVEVFNQDGYYHLHGLFTESVDSCRLVTALLTDRQKRDYATKVRQKSTPPELDFCFELFRWINAEPAILAAALCEVLRETK